MVNITLVSWNQPCMMGQFILWKSANATTQVFPLPPSWPTVKYGLAWPCVLSIMWPGCSKARLFNSHTYFSPFYLGLSRTTSYHNIEKSVRKNCASFLNSKQRRELQVGKGSGQTRRGSRQGLSILSLGAVSYSVGWSKSPAMQKYTSPLWEQLQSHMATGMGRKMVITKY